MAKSLSFTYGYVGILCLSREFLTWQTRLLTLLAKKVLNLQNTVKIRLVVEDLLARKDTSFANNPTDMAPYPPVMSQQNYFHTI